MIDWLRVKYKILARLHPGCLFGATTGELDDEWDKELWNLLLDGQIKFVDSHIALIGEKEVWIANFPYASGSERIGSGISKDNGKQCSRATALFLEHELKAARIIVNLKYTKQEQENFLIRKYMQEMGLL